MNKNFKKDRRGISHVISEIILIAVTIALCFAIVAFSQVQLSYQHTRMGENLTVEKVQMTSTTITAYVRNTGDSPLTLSYAVVDGQSYSLLDVNGHIVKGQINANGQYVYINGTFAPNTPHIVKFVTTNLNSFSIQVSYP